MFKMKIFDVLKEQSDDKQRRIKTLLADLDRLQSAHKYADHGAYSQDERRMADIQDELEKLGYFADLRDKNQSVQKPKPTDPKEISVQIDDRGSTREMVLKLDHVENAGEHTANAENGINYPVEVYRSYEYVRSQMTGEWVKQPNHFGGIAAKAGVISDGAKLKVVNRVWVTTPSFHRGKIDLVEPIG